jgi:hypothetical protein
VRIQRRIYAPEAPVPSPRTMAMEAATALKGHDILAPSASALATLLPISPCGAAVPGAGWRAAVHEKRVSAVMSAAPPLAEAKRE